MVVEGFQVLASTRNLLVSQRSNIQSVVEVPTSRISKASSHSPSRVHSPTTLYIFGGLFGGGSSTKLALSEDVPLTVYSSSSTTGRDNDKQYDSLGDYIEKWSKLFTNGNIHLTTPVTVELVVVPNDEDGVRRRGIRLLFKDTRTGYQSKTEEQESNSSQPHAASLDDTQANKKKKKQGSSKVKQGGVEILVEQNSKGVQVTAKRCEIEDDTIIKEMSEETILNELKQAIEVWKRETQ